MEFGDPRTAPRRSASRGRSSCQAAKQRALLATLLLAHRDEAVSPERLTDVLWGEEPPATAHKALQVHISQLRRALGPEQPIVTLAVRLRRRARAGPARPRALRDARRARPRAPAATAPAAGGRRLLREALALFRGPPLADAPLLGPAAAEPERLAGLRLAALEERLDVELALGEPRARWSASSRRWPPSTPTASACTRS